MAQDISGAKAVYEELKTRFSANVDFELNRGEESMKVSEFYALAEWVNKKIVKGQIVQKYQALLNILSRNMQFHQQKG
ncbi:MAG: hypothetical protein LBH85_08200 [Treponema sp.]|nr:hypothetical protein [Treponema sp.]